MPAFFYVERFSIKFRLVEETAREQLHFYFHKKIFAVNKKTHRLFFNSNFFAYID